VLNKIQETKNHVQEHYSRQEKKQQDRESKKEVTRQTTGTKALPEIGSPSTLMR